MPDSTPSVPELNIQPSPQHPAFWQFLGEDTLLLGGSLHDNLFQMDHLEEHLELLTSCGGNYVRGNISSNDPGDVWFCQPDPESGLCDLNDFSGPYWDKLKHFVDATRERGIVAQLEIFDRFNYNRGPWNDNPFNPKNNCNYTTAESSLDEEYPEHPSKRRNPFFRAPPALEDNTLLRRFQEAYVDKVLEITLGQPHLLYCISNETNEDPAWGAYWADYIQQKAHEAATPVFITEMWDAWDLHSDMHRATFDHPERYAFADISQNNMQQGWTHWQNLHSARDLIHGSGHIRPVNTVKIYGAHWGRYGNHRDGQERFWRNVFGGLAAIRFHRPPSGLGLSRRAQAHIRSARMLTSAIDWFSGHPIKERLVNAALNEAYAYHIPGEATAVFFTDGGNVWIDAENLPANLGIRWLEIASSTWHEWEPVERQSDGLIQIATPRDEGYWACILGGWTEDPVNGPQASYIPKLSKRK